MTQPSRIVRFAVLAFGILFLDSAAFAQQSQSWKFPLSIPTTQSGYPSPVVASTGPLAAGTYSITAKTSLQNLYSAREPSGKCFLVLLDANGNVISGSQLDETDVTLDETSNGADTASITLSSVYVVTASGPNNVGVHCTASQQSQFTNTVITATSLQGPTGAQGPAGAPGAPGAQGAAGPAGAPGTPGAQGAAGPAGSPGTPGAAATITVGMVSVGSSGQAAVSNVGTPNAAVLNFLIPQGPSGPPGSAGSGGGGFSGIQEFTESGTFTVPAGVTHLLVELWGAGGGGGGGLGGTDETGCDQFGLNCTSTPILGNSGTPGGGGSYTRAVVVVTPGATYSIVLGAGGSGGAGTASISVSPSGGTGGNTSIVDASGNVLATATGGGSPSGGVGTPGQNTVVRNGSSGTPATSPSVPGVPGAAAVGSLPVPGNAGQGGVGGRAGVGGGASGQLGGTGNPGYALITF